MQLAFSATEPLRGRFSLQMTAMLLATLCISIGGCGGCRPQTPEQQAQAKKAAEEKARQKLEAEAKEKKKKQEFEVAPPVPQPSESGQALLVKPGHWISVSQSMKANHNDFVGETTLRVLDKQRQLLPIPKTPYTLSATRPVVLVKGREKSIDSTLFIPPAEEQIQLQAILRERNSGRRFESPSPPLTLMPAYQYFILVLAKEPARYTFLKTLSSIKAPVDTEDSSDDIVHYHLLLPDISRTVPLPENSLTWSSVAYIVWDEVDPQQLSEAQRTALLDWLHWGGQLLVSGPDSLDLLQSSFLAPFLPADSEGTRTIDTFDLAALNQTWTNSKGKNSRPLSAGTPWSGAKLKPRNLVGHPLPGSGDLLVERRVGGGRIMVSAFQLAERDLLLWGPSLDHFVNSALLRRESRQFSRGPYDELHVTWANKPDHRLDASLNSKLRYFGRDTHDDPQATNYRKIEVPMDTTPSSSLPPGRIDGTPLEETQPPLLPGGVASWNDISAPAVAAGAALREAAGVEVPGGKFVLIGLGAYLLVLIPLNWAIFQSIGRVEWAWIAAPLIALAGTWVVVRQAQLDIGFVRAETEIAVLELQPNYPRGHLTRFTGLYTSLSTTYELAYDSSSALAAPYPAGELLPGQALVDVAFSQRDKVRLSNLEVNSASTRMVHSEEMTLASGGSILIGESSLREKQIVNRSDLRLHSVAVLKRIGNSDKLEGCWIGELRVGTSAILKFAPIDSSYKVAFAKDRAEEQKDRPGGLLNLEQLFQVACDPRHFEPNEMRLVARVDEILPGSTVAPAASQSHGATLVVAHLEYGELPPPELDANSPLDVMVQSQ